MSGREFADMYMGYDARIIRWGDNFDHQHVGKVGTIVGSSTGGACVLVDFDPPLDNDFRPDRRYFTPEELELIGLAADRKKPLPLPG